MVNEKQQINKGDIMVCVWGATMILTDWAVVTKITDKTLVVESIESHSWKPTLAGMNHVEEYGRPYIVPFEDKRRKHIRRAHGEPEKIRLYKKINSNGEEYFFTRKQGFSKVYDKWDGQPIQEDHND